MITYEQRITELAEKMARESYAWYCKNDESQRYQPPIFEHLPYWRKEEILSSVLPLAKIAVDEMAEVARDAYQLSKYGYSNGLEEYIKAATEKYLTDNGLKQTT